MAKLEAGQSPLGGEPLWEHVGKGRGTFRKVNDHVIPLAVARLPWLTMVCLDYLALTLL